MEILSYIISVWLVVISGGWYWNWLGGLTKWANKQSNILILSLLLVKSFRTPQFFQFFIEKYSV